MAMEPTGSSGRTTPPPPVITTQVDGEHQRRSVSPNTSGTSVAGHQYPADYHFTPLDRRQITRKTVNLGKTISILTRFATPRITWWFTEVMTNQLKDLKRRADSLAKEGKNDKQKMSKYKKEIVDLRKQLDKLRPKLAQKKSKNIRHFQRLQQRLHKCLEELPELEAAVTSSGTERDIVRQTERQLAQQKDLTESLLKSAIHSGAKCIAGLKKVHKAKKKPENANTAYDIPLGDLTFEDAGRYKITLENVRMAVDQCHANDDGTFTIRVAEYKANCVSDNPKASSAEPVEVVGGFTLTCKPPLSGYLSEILNAPKFKIAGELSDKWKAMLALLEHPREDGSKASIMDYVDIHLSGFSQNLNGGCFDLLTQHGAETLVKILTPVAASQKQDRDNARLTELHNNLALLQKRKLQAELVIVSLTKFVTTLEDDILQAPEAETRTLLQTMKAEVETKVALEIAEKERCQKALDHEQASLRAASLVASDRDAWLESYNNMIKLWFDLRSIQGKVSPEGPREINLKQQRIRLGESGYVDIERMKCSVSRIQMEPGGKLNITMPQATARLCIGSHLSTDKESANLKLGDASLSVDPPLSQMIWDILTLKFPVNASRLYEIRKQFRALTTLPPDSPEQEARSSLKDLLHFKIGYASKLSESGEELVEDQHTPDSAAMAGKVRQLSGADVDQEQIETLLTSNVTMDDGSQRQLMNLLSMALLGLGHVATAEKKQSIKQVAATVAQTAVSPEPEPTRPDTSFAEITQEELEQPDTATDADPDTEDASEDQSVYTDAPTNFAEEQALVDEDLTVDPELEPSVLEVYQSELSDVDGISETSFMTVQDHLEASFEIHSQLTSLFGQLSLFSRWLLGKAEVTLQVVTPIDERGVVKLDTPKIKLRKAGLIRRMMVNRMLKKALKKRSLVLAVDDSSGQKELLLRNPQPVVPAPPPDVTAS